MNMHCLRPVCAAFCVAALLTFSGCPSLSPGIGYTRNITYGEGYVTSTRGQGHVLTDLKLDIIVLSAPARTARPAVLMIHGGSFEGGSRSNENLVDLADALAVAGYACFLMDYRLMGDGPPAPPPYSEDELKTAAHAALVDTKAALRFIRENAGVYDIDPSRIAVLGESAGAIAALGAGLSDPTDFTSDGDAFPIPEGNYPGRDFKPAAILDLWGTAAEFEEEFDAGDPPVFIAHGVLDLVIPATEAALLASWCDGAGIPFELYPFFFEGHGAWDGVFDGKTLPELVIRFLDAWV